MSDLEYLERAFDLAQIPLGCSWPNPLVGAVIVINKKIVGEGYHKKSGLPHAEIEALSDFFSRGGQAEELKQATLYCTLEPCCHENKKTPPCVKEILKYKIPRVVIICLDPNPEVSGKGKALLEAQGVRVDLIERLEGKYKKLNAPFWCAMTKKRPHIHLKWAQSLDGKMAKPNGLSKWITNHQSRSHAHFLRGTHQAIMIGSGTLIMDDPQLNVRYGHEKKLFSPLKIVLLGRKPLPSTSQIFKQTETPVLLVKTSDLPSPDIKNLSHVELLELPADNNFRIPLDLLLKNLFERKIYSVLVEGGPTLISEFINQDLADEVSIFVAPKIFGQGISPTENLAFSSISEIFQISAPDVKIFGEDIYINGHLSRADLSQ